MLLRSTVAWMLVFFSLGLCLADNTVADITEAGQRPITIGVLAKRGTQVAIERWSPTADYLNQQIPDLHFHILPLTFEQIPQQIKSQGIDLLLANSAIYIQSEHNFHAFRIATLINRSSNFPLASFDGAEQVTRIVRSMRVFAHPEKPTAEKSDLNKLIHDVVAISRHRWSHAATIEFGLHEPTLEADCFPGDISQALLNLLVNAVQAVEERSDEPPGAIHISSRKLPTYVEIRVGDNGSGIPPEARDHIFNPFFTTRDVGQGSGQGLTLTHDIIVRKHRGSLRFDTEMERGTVFTIRLPIHSDEESPSPAVDAVDAVDAVLS
ncbi:MAG: hypothetical protein KZQ65_07635 [Candidatus Thiodiazotropha sp. (ex Gloverina cf. vestifex)]|nr:hypothetical protein [Candidatus Thiodiazotropha sp. (ex Gloverina cf. vestifex)]